MEGLILLERMGRCVRSKPIDFVCSAGWDVQMHLKINMQSLGLFNCCQNITRASSFVSSLTLMYLKTPYNYENYRQERLTNK